MHAGWPAHYPALVFSPAEVELYTTILTEVDRHHANHINGANGAAFLKRSGLPQAVLHEVTDGMDVNADLEPLRPSR